ncbi:L-seryl-tRNA(Sec) selenium transferase [Raoultibacter phocaeensis]|uniref:L-seryl-tRNA(Sec) selenium transferase n=1 Tax=Raoultibacter phocaeensis TaxID=2479841 RepID=UPI00111A5637|nr:L-seryl-tRNA(Sec) selenium transferase [Raoultibacter phocaeensis]
MAQPPNTDLLRSLPQIEEVLRDPQLKALEALMPRSVLADCAREAVDNERNAILTGSRSSVDAQAIADEACSCALANLRPSLRRVINATGVILHTNLGRSVLADEAVHAVEEVARGYSTLEYDTAALARGSRHDHVERLICAVTGAEAAIAVNNNAAAVMMVLVEFAAGREAIVSRGELVEIGGSFRVPDIMALSRAEMVEVGTTNKTHAADYARAVGPDTAMLLKVHPSNYRIVGFSESVPVHELRRIADSENAARHSEAGPASVNEVLVYEDQGSGSLIRLDCFGSYAEPTVAESLKAGCDLVSFSGDKLLGGPQAGIVVGSRRLIERLKKNPLARALRLDKMTLAALEATLRIYLDPERALRAIPTLRMLSEPSGAVQDRAENLARAITEAIPQGAATVDVVAETARAGGGSLPLCDIDSFAVRISFERGNAQGCETFLATSRRVPIIGRIKKDAVLLDARTLTHADIAEVAAALRAYFDSLDPDESSPQTHSMRIPGEGR